MFNDILNDIWNNYRGRLLCSVFGVKITHAGKFICCYVLPRREEL